MEKSCAKCGRVFECISPASQCWCNEVSVDYARWEDQLNTFDGCLYQDCLALFKVGVVGQSAAGAAVGVEEETPLRPAKACAKSV